MSNPHLPPPTTYFSDSGLDFFIRHAAEKTVKKPQQPSPACLYLTASWHDSLCHSELGKFADFLFQQKTNVLSVDLPFHYKGCSYDAAILKWKEKALEGEPCIQPYARSIAQSLIIMEERGLLDLSFISFAGLSRGAYAALYILHELKALRPQLSPPTILFAPLTTLTSSIYAVENLDADFFPIPKPMPPLFLSIGNNDTRVDTDKALHFYRQYTEHALQRSEIHDAQDIRSDCADTTLYIHPSIGFKGHGTPDFIFKTASEWLQTRMLQKFQE